MIKCGIETRHFQIYKAAKILYLSRTFSQEAIGECASPKKTERKTRKHGIEKKGDITQNRKIQDKTLAISI